MNQPTRRLFQHMNQLALDIDWPINSFDLLSTLTDLSQFTEIWLFLSDYHYFDSNTLYMLLDQACNVRTLGISYDNDSTLITEDIFAVISRQIEHLKVRTTDVDCMQLILEYVENLSSVTFIRDRGSASAWTDMIEWLIQRGSQFSQSDDHKSLQVWLGAVASEKSQITTGHCRVTNEFIRVSSFFFDIYHRHVELYIYINICTSGGTQGCSDKLCCLYIYRAH